MQGAREEMEADDTTRELEMPTLPAEGMESCAGV
jgi:hypothetical protein